MMSSQKIADFSLMNALVSKCHMRELWKRHENRCDGGEGRFGGGVGWGGDGFEETQDGSPTSATQ